MTATISPRFAENLLNTIDDPSANPVHLLFNQFWQDVPDEVASAYARQFEHDDRLRAWVAEAHYPEPLTMERLSRCPEGSLGAAMFRFIGDNGLEEKLATNYQLFHRALEQSGMLDGMPQPLRYAVLRGFQLHDFMHVITGYGPDRRGEIALQAFCLAQLQFPYFAMWISVVTSRMTFIDPSHIVGLMDAITEGWQFGRSVANIQIDRWEDHLDEPLADLRRRAGIAPEGLRPLTPTGLAAAS